MFRISRFRCRQVRHPVLRLTATQRAPSRCFTSSVERVEVPCRGSGSITIDLHGVPLEPSTQPILIHIPPLAPSPDSPPYLPSFLTGFPTAVINYRWSGPSFVPPSFDERPDEGIEPLKSRRDQLGLEETDQAQDGPDFATPLRWPTPLHDISFAYQWIIDNLPPPGSSRRDLYVHGSHLGATLATSLALTECHKHERMAVRGLAAYNGIYNWTMFLPDHKINQSSSAGRGKSSPGKLPPAPVEGTPLWLLREAMPELFGQPTNMFDPFASPSLFFQTTGMLTPQDFNQTTAFSQMVNRMAALGIDGSPADLMPEATTLHAMKPPRRSALVFPPRKSTLQIPQSLFLHESAVVPSASTTITAATAKRKRKTASTSTTVTSKSAPRKRKAKGNHFEAQALEMAGLMRRSVEKLELKDRMQWDEDFDDWDAVLNSRVRVVDVGNMTDEEGLDMNAFGQDIVRQWLEDRILL